MENSDLAVGNLPRKASSGSQWVPVRSYDVMRTLTDGSDD